MPTFTVDFIARFAQMKDAIDRISKDTENMSNRMNKAFSTIKKGLIGGFIAREAIGFIKDVTEETIKFEKSQALLANTLKQTGFAAGLTTKQLEAMNDQLSAKTGFDDTDIRQAEVALLRFSDIDKKVFEQALARSADLAASLGTEIPDAAQTIARALENPEQGFKGLRGVVKQLTESEVEAIKAFKAAGDEAAAMQIVLDHLNNISGAAEATNKGLGASVKELDNAWSDFQKTLGLTTTYQAIATTALDLLSGGLRLVSDVVADLTSNLEKSKRLLDEIAGLPVPKDPEDEKAESGRREEKQRANAEAERKRQAQQRKLDAALAKVDRDKEVADAKLNSQVALDILEFQYDHGEILTQDYYAAKLRVAQNANAIEVDSARKAVAAQEALLTHSKDTQERITKELVDLQKQRAAALAKGDQSEVKRIDQTAGRLKAQTAASPDEERAIRAEIARLKNDQARKEQEGADLERKNFQEITIESQRLLDVETNITAELLEQNGQLAQAERLKRSGSVRSTQTDLKKIGDPVAFSQFAQLTVQKDASSELREILRDVGLEQDKLANKERDLASQVEQGQTTELEALQRTNEERKKTGLILEELALEAEKAARVSVKPEDKVAADGVAVALRSMAASYSEAATAAKALSIQTRETNLSIGALAIAEEKIAAARASGVITSQEALRQSDAARQKLVVTLRRQLETQQALASKGGDTIAAREARQNVEALEAALKSLEASSHQVQDQLRLMMTDGLVDPLIDVVNKTKTADQALKSFFNNIAQGLLRLEAKRFSEWLIGGTSSDSSAGIFGLISRFAGGFGFGAGSEGGVGQSQGETVFGSAKGNIMTSAGPLKLERFASGGVTHGPILSLAGEAGPEAIIPLPDGRSVPVTLKGLDSSKLTPAVQPTLAQTQRGPKGQQGAASSPVVLQIHPAALQMTLRDWFEGELARQAATR